MAEKKLVSYPVDNGQSIRLDLDDDTFILFDLKQKPDLEKEDDKTWDVKGSLLKDLPLRDDRSVLSVFSLSHADLDHCQGFGDVFLLPGQNEDKDTDEKTLIQIDELWVTAQIFNEEFGKDSNSQGAKVQKEARRRLKLWSDPKKINEAEEPGNQLVIFGNYDDEKGIENLPDDRHIYAGEVFNKICGEVRSDFEMFIHWPFKSAVDDVDMERNEVSLIAQITIIVDENKNQILMGGDAGCGVWKKVYEKSEEKGNLEKLDWDIFIIPHHGTYKFFTEKDHEEGRWEAENDPVESSMSILDRGSENCWLICSSRIIKDDNYDDKQPPHKEGIKHYRKCAEDKGDKNHFVSLMEVPKKTDPKPFVIRFTAKGVQKEDNSSAKLVTGAESISQTQRWG